MPPWCTVHNIYKYNDIIVYIHVLFLFKGIVVTSNIYHHFTIRNNPIFWYTSRRYSCFFSRRLLWMRKTHQKQFYIGERLHQYQQSISNMCRLLLFWYLFPIVLFRIYIEVYIQQIGCALFLICFFFFPGRELYNN